MQMNRFGVLGICLATAVSLTSSVSAEQGTVQQVLRAQLFGYGEGVANGVLVNGKQRLLKTEANRHNPAATDRIESLSVPGIELEVRRVPVRPDRPLLERLVVTRDGFPLIRDLRIGVATTEAIERILGKPDQRKGSEIAYVGLNEMCEDFLYLRFRGGKLVAAEWEWCSD